MVYRVGTTIRQFRRRLTAIQRRQLPFATALALTATAKDVQRNVEKAIDRGFDRPTPFTRRAIGITAARKTRLIASVFVKRIQAQYLAVQETGGERRPRGRALVLPAAARLNRYGNLPRGAVRRLLGRPDTFSGTVRGIAGIWQRRGRSVSLVVAYEPKARYRPRLGFMDTARKTARARFPIQMRRALERALATAR